MGNIDTSCHPPENCALVDKHADDRNWYKLARTRCDASASSPRQLADGGAKVSRAQVWQQNAFELEIPEDRPPAEFAPRKFAVVEEQTPATATPSVAFSQSPFGNSGHRSGETSARGISEEAINNAKLRRACDCGDIDSIIEALAAGADIETRHLPSMDFTDGSMHIFEEINFPLAVQTDEVVKLARSDTERFTGGVSPNAFTTPVPKTEQMPREASMAPRFDRPSPVAKPGSLQDAMGESHDALHTERLVQWTPSPKEPSNFGCDRTYGLTPLMHAAKAGQALAVALLLDAKASPSASEESGMQPLHLAAASGSRDACSYLLDAGACPHALDDNHRNAFACLPPHAVAKPQDQQEWAAILKVPAEVLEASTVVANPPLLKATTPPAILALAISKLEQCEDAAVGADAVRTAEQQQAEKRIGRKGR